MRRNALLLTCIMFFLLSGSSRGEVIQHFDASGNLAPEARRSVPSPAHNAQKYSVAQGLGLRPDIRYEFYPVFGRTYAEIVKSAEENGPFSKETRTRRTSAFFWSMGWSYQFSYTTEYDEENDKLHCDIIIRDVAFSYDISITLPVLTDNSFLNDIEKDLWKNYVVRLLDIEHGRVKIVKDEQQEGILRHMSEINYLPIDAGEEDRAAALIEQYVREETARIGKETVKLIREKLDQYSRNGETAQSPDSHTPASKKRR